MSSYQFLVRDTSIRVASTYKKSATFIIYELVLTLKYSYLSMKKAIKSNDPSLEPTVSDGWPYSYIMK